MVTISPLLCFHCGLKDPILITGPPEESIKRDYPYVNPFFKETDTTSGSP